MLTLRVDTWKVLSSARLITEACMSHPKSLPFQGHHHTSFIHLCKYKNGCPSPTELSSAVLQALPTWPNVLSTGSKPAAEGVGEGPGRESRLARLEAVVRRRAPGPHTLLARHSEALWLAYKPLTRPDKELLERWAAALLQWRHGDCLFCGFLSGCCKNAWITRQPEQLPRLGFSVCDERIVLCSQAELNAPLVRAMSSQLYTYSCV